MYTSIYTYVFTYEDKVALTHFTEA